MKPVRFYREAYRAVTDFGSYADIMEQPLTRTVLYLLYLVGHVALVYTVAAGIYQLPWLHEGVRWARENFPTIVFHQGRLSIPEAEPGKPIVREYFGRSVWTFVFDPAGVEDPYKVRRPAVVMNPEKCLLIVDSDVQLSWAWSEVAESATVDRQTWSEVEDNLSTYFWPFSFATFFIFYLMVKPLQAALFTFVSAVAAVRMGVRLPFSYHFSLCVYALTPAVAIDLVLQLVNILEFGDFLPIYIATAAIYAYRGTQAPAS